MAAAALWWLPGSATLPPNNNAKLTNFARPIPLNCNFCPNCLLFLCSNGLNRGQSFENDMEVEERGFWVRVSRKRFYKCMYLFMLFSYLFSLS